MSWKGILSMEEAERQPALEQCAIKMLFSTLMRWATASPCRVLWPARLPEITGCARRLQARWSGHARSRTVPRRLDAVRTRTHKTPTISILAKDGTVTEGTRCSCLTRSVPFTD